MNGRHGSDVVGILEEVRVMRSCEGAFGPLLRAQMKGGMKRSAG